MERYAPSTAVPLASRRACRDAHPGLCLVLLSLCVSASAPAQSVSFTQYPIPTSNSDPEAIVPGPDGALWFAETNGNQIGRITTAGTITEYPVPSPNAGLAGLTAGPDGALWFTEETANKIGRITTSGSVTEYIIPTSGAFPRGITAGPDGALWFAEQVPHKVGRITTSGTFTEYPVEIQPYDITAGPDGALWLTDQVNSSGGIGGGVIGRLTTSGAFTQYPVPSGNQPFYITSGPDGALWFTEFAPQQGLGRITTAGVVNEYNYLNLSGFGITSGPGGAVWFAGGGDFIGKITTSGSDTLYPMPVQTAQAYGITAGPDGALWFTDTYNNIWRAAVSSSGPPAVIKIISGNNQSVNAGMPAPQPLIAEVTDVAGNPSSGAAVTWSVTAGSATLSNVVTSSASNGDISANVTPTAGPVQVTVALAGNSAVQGVFTVNVSQPITALQIVSGNNQQAQVGKAFANPLIVQVNDNNLPAPDVTVTFTVPSGSATLSALTVVTNLQGQAQVMVTAGSTAGPVSVLASATSEGVTYTQTFDLSVTAGAALASSPGSLTFTYEQGGGRPAPQQLIITSPAPNIALTFTASTTGGVDWLPGYPVTGISAVNNYYLTVLVSAAGLGIGTYSGTITVTTAGYSPLSVPVTLNVVQPVPTITLISPASATAGGPAFTLTVSGFGFVECASPPCLAVDWQPAGGSPTQIPAQANAGGTQVVATIPAALIAAADTAVITVQASGGTSNPVPFTIAAPCTNCVSPGASHLVFPNLGLNALQEFDPVQLAIVRTIPLPFPFTYASSAASPTVRIRKSDGGILTTAYTNGIGVVLALSSSGQFVAAEQAPGESTLQQLAFDPLDSTQSTVLAGNETGADVIAADPYNSAQSARISQKGANFTGLATDSVGRLYAGIPDTGQIFRYLPDGTQGGVFADVAQTTGSGEIDALAIDSDNNVYVAQGNSNRIAKFDKSGNFLAFLMDPALNGNVYVFFNPGDGLLYAGNQGDDGLIVLTTAGTPVTVVHMGGSVGVPDVAPGAPAPPQGLMDTTLTGLTFQTPQDGSAPPPQSFAVINNTTAALTFSTKISYTVTGAWLSLSGGSGTVATGQLSAPIVVTVNPAGLTPGDYYGTVEIDAAGAPNSPRFVTVVLNILPAKTIVQASLAPTGMIFTAVVNGSNPAAQSVAVSDVLNRSTSFTASSTAAAGPIWFTVTPAQGTVQPGQTENLQVQANVGNLAAGVYTGTLTLQFPQDNVTRQIPLLLVVATSATEIARDKFAPRQAVIPCQPTQLLMVFTQLGAGFSQDASWPATLETFVVDDCGVPVVSGSVTVAFSDGEAALPLISQNDGTWSQTWSPSGATSSLTLTATAVSQGLTGSVQIGGTVQPNPDIPVLNANGIVSAASFAPGAIPSPGEIVSIFGSNLADGAEPAAQLPLPTQMQNAFVLLGGQTMPLLYVSPTQINAVVPYGFTGGTAYQAVARHGNRLSTPQRIALGSGDPAVFTTKGSGQGQGHVYLEPGNTLADSHNPATAGDVLTMYTTGLGAVNQPVTAGSAAPSKPLAYTASTVSVTIGGQPAKVSFAGLAPGYAGLYQINAKVPSGVPTGDQIPVVITVDGVSSPLVTIAVK